LPQAAEASQTSAIVDEIERQIDRATEPCDTDEAIEAYIVRKCRGSDDEDDDAMEQEDEEPEPEEVPSTASEAAKALTNSVPFLCYYSYSMVATNAGTKYYGPARCIALSAAIWNKPLIGVHTN